MDWVKISPGICIALLGIWGILLHLRDRKNTILWSVELIVLVIMVIGGAVWTIGIFLP